MRAIVYEKYGSPEVLESRALPSPEPKAGQVLIEVKAAALNPKDSFVRKGRFVRVTGKKFPRRLGYDFAGIVRVIGDGVKDVRIGDEVFGMLNGWDGGTVAEEICADADELATRPARLSFVEAAAIPLAAQTALQALRDEGRVKPGQRVLIHGASGGVGVNAIQIARILGAHVTTTSSPKNFELCRELGAHETRDYATKSELTPGSNWDVFFDVFGNRSFPMVRTALSKFGRYVSTVPSTRIVVQQLVTRVLPRKARLVVVKSNHRDLAQLAEWIDAEQLAPVVDRIFSLDDVAKAQAHVETKRTRGKVVVQVDVR